MNRVDVVYIVYMWHYSFSLPQASQHASYSWCRLLPRYRTNSKRSIALCFRYLKAKHVDTFPSSFFNQYLLCHRYPEDKEPVFFSFLASWFIGLPIISIEHNITLSRCEFLSDDKPDLKLTRMSSLVNEVKSDSGITEHQNSYVESSFGDKDVFFSDESDSFGLGTLFCESQRCRNDDMGKESQPNQSSNKAGDIGNRRELSGDESLGLENLFDEDFHRKDAMRPRAPKQTSKQSKRARRKRKRKAGGIDDDDDDKAIGGSESLNNADTPSLKKKPKKIVPNYFVAIRVSNPDIHAGVKIVQDSLVTHNKRLKDALIPLETLHLTLLVVHLQDNEQILKAAGIMNQCQASLEPILQNGALTLTFSGLDHFGHQVLFVKLGGEEELVLLNSVANIIRETFEKEGIPSTDSRDFIPHLTVMKLSRSPKLRKKGVKKIPVESYTNWVNFKFGEDSVNALYLCSMNDKKDEQGFYKSVASLHFPSDIGVEDPSQATDDTLKNDFTETH